jgi:ORF6N domain
VKSSGTSAKKGHGASAAVAVEAIASHILPMRGLRVMLDADLAALYGVQTRRLNEQVRRNRERFPQDFIFELTPEEFADLKSQFATSSWGGRRKLPLAFLTSLRLLPQRLQQVREVRHAHSRCLVVALATLVVPVVAGDDVP